MFCRRIFFFVFIIILFFPISIISQNNIPAPEEFFGFEPGSDGNLFKYEKMIEYFKILNENSGMLEMRQIGYSPMGRVMYAVFISSEENISKLDELKAINEKIALDAGLTDQEKEKYIKEGKVFALATLSMHSTEVAPAQASPLLAYNLITGRVPEISKFLDEMVYMFVPNHNPDGMNMIVEHYYKYKGTKYEGSSMPGVYHKYAGHDNNRDFVTLTQSDTRAVSDLYSKTWFPQVMVEKHQMGSTGPRYFVPPSHDPIAENVDELIWNWTGVFGAALITDMTTAGLEGVSQRYLFDDYWPGSTTTSIWKNVASFLTEAASVRIATPIYIEPLELRVYGKGLSEYKKSTNMPDPWPGGWWRLSDIVEYELVSAYSIIKTSAKYREEIIRFKIEITDKEVEKGRTEAPYYYVLPLRQHDKSELVSLVNLLSDHGVELYRLKEEFTDEDYRFDKGDIVVPLAQPFRAFIKEVMEVQVYPVRHYTPGGEIIKPYDIASWSLPLHKGVNSIEINKPIPDILKKIEIFGGTLYDDSNNLSAASYLLFTSNNNSSYRAAFKMFNAGIEVSRTKEDFSDGNITVPAGSFIVQTAPEVQDILSELRVPPAGLTEKPDVTFETLTAPRIALVETWFHDMQAGWTRYVLDTYNIEYDVLRPSDIPEKDLAVYDVIILPSNSKSVLLKGRYERGGDYYISSYPPEYVEGMGDDGYNKLLKYINEGGSVVAWERSGELFDGNLKIKNGEEKEDFSFPYNDNGGDLRKEGLYVPGSLVKVLLKQDHPVTYGMRDETGVFYRGRYAYKTSVPRFDTDRRILGWFPEKDILVSGYAEEEELLEGHAVLLWLNKGKGNVVLFGFNPLFRASTEACYKLFFNSLLLK